MRSQKKVSQKPSKSDSKTEMHLDRISNLPDTVIDHILSYLPIRDRAKTSTLSSKWRYKWATVPCLVFDNQSLPLLIDNQGIFLTNKLVSDIDRVLLLHHGPICKFELSYEHHLPTVDIDKWILHLSRYPIKEFKFSKYQSYKLPSCIFSWQNLTHLDLINCLLKPPSTFKGFKNLKSLNLRNIKLDQDVFENLISSSPMLEKLTLAYLGGVDHLKITAPNLQFLNFEGPFVDFSLKNTSHIAVFSMNSHANYKNNPMPNLIKLLADMPQIEKLVLEDVSLEILVHGVIPRALPVPCANLHYLSIVVNLSSFNETSTLLCLLRSIPNLQVLDIGFLMESGETTVNDWEADQWNCPFTHLRFVEMSYFSGIPVEIDFISFMLLTSPVLTKMVVNLDKGAECSDKMKLRVSEAIAMPQARFNSGTDHFQGSMSFASQTISYRETYRLT